ncbi:Uncharacterized protein TCM_045180 [Theobroma cacao]|uniref:Integrase catalytic domain-containing protein n=1 Tax=Theobroma cacao TaxID=3641 RepID=A0A061FSF1_THECC|nr:Uncharacterized protein TCM_045180 [Theobroma cacao]
METYLRAYDLWGIIAARGDPLVLSVTNPTIAQLKQHNKEVAKRYKALSVLHSTIYDSIFTRIMNCQSPKEVWDKIKEEFFGNDRTRQIQALNLWREFETLRMDDEETVQDFSEKVHKIVNHLRLLGEELSEKRIINKFLVSVPEKYELKISSLEDFKDLSSISVNELLNALQAQEQRGALRQDKVVEGVLMARNADKRHNSCKQIFQTLDDNFKTKMEIGNGDFLLIFGVGTVRVQTLDGLQSISNVFYELDVSQNLLSVRHLLDDNYELVFKDKACTVKDPTGVELLTVGMKNKCFPLDWMKVNHFADNCTMTENDLWHKRFGHVNYGSLKLMSTDKMVLLHTNLGGHMKTSSLNGSKYYLLFINDYTRFSWVYFLKVKSNALNAFIKYKALVENQTNLTSKMLRSDNGTEYATKEFEGHLSKFGVMHQLIVSYSSQQNGVFERKNRTLMEMARCLLFEKNLPKTLWAEAMNTANYLLNLCSTKALVSKTPYEAWYGLKPFVDHLKIFGCICYAKIPDAKRTKLDEKSVIVIHLGYSEVSKGYRLLNVMTMKFFVSRDIVFDESMKWNWNTKAMESSYSQHILIDYISKNEDEPESVARHDTIRLLMALATCEGWEIWHLDIKSAFFNGTIKENIYVEQLEGFVQLEREDKVCKLLKTLYGLKQAPRA